MTAKNLCLNQIRHNNIVKDYQAKNQFSIFDDTDIVNAIVSSEISSRIYQAIETLPAQCREVTRMAYIQGLKNQEIADNLQISINSVRVHKQRAIHLLRDKLSKKDLLLMIIFEKKLILFSRFFFSCVFIVNNIDFMDRKTYHIIQLLFKYYRETLSVSEKAELDAWLAEDERNRELLKSYEHFSRFIQDMHFYGETDVENGYERVFRKIEIQQKKMVNRMRWIGWGSVVASLLIVVTCMILWQRGTNERERHSMITLASPDRSGVQLQLSDGKTISLTKCWKYRKLMEEMWQQMTRRELFIKIYRRICRKGKRLCIIR